MKIQLCQTNIIWENKELNLKKAEKIIENSQCDMLLFPEMSFTGFSNNTSVTGESDSFTVNKLKDFSLKYNKTLGFGWVYKASEKAENHYTFVSNGNVLADYAKIHPFSYGGEDEFFVGGNDLTVFEYKGFKFAPLICYDLRFPEIFQAVSKKADIITVAANWPASRSEHWKTLLKARAIENMCYIVAVNCVGAIGGLDYSGDSCVITPNGDVIDMLSGAEGSVICDINNDVADYRKKFPTKDDRKVQLYIDLYKKMLL